MGVTLTPRQVLGLTCALLEIQGLPDVVGGQGSPGGRSCRKHVRFTDQLLSAGLGSTPLPIPLSGRVLRMAKAAVDLSPLTCRHLFRFAERFIVAGIRSVPRPSLGRRPLLHIACSAFSAMNSNA